MTTLTQGWRPREDLVIGKSLYGGRNRIDGKIRVAVQHDVIEVLTPQGVRTRVIYEARGDYEDRWVSRHGEVTEFTCWRPVR